MDTIDRIRSLREDSDTNQSDIAKLLNIGQKTYSDYETRKIRIPLESVIILAKYYNVDMNYICGISDVKKPFPNKWKAAFRLLFNCFLLYWSNRKVLS